MCGAIVARSRKTIFCKIEAPDENSVRDTELSGYVGSSR
jgi:hypothetical protein